MFSRHWILVKLEVLARASSVDMRGQSLVVAMISREENRHKASRGDSEDDEEY